MSADRIDKLRKALVYAMDELGGVWGILGWRREDPEAFRETIGLWLPKELNRVDVDEEVIRPILERRLAALRAMYGG